MKSRNAMVNLVWLVALFVVLGQHLPSVRGIYLPSVRGICQKFAFFIDKEVVPDHAVEGHVCKMSTVDRATQFHVMCKDDCRCISMNCIHINDQDNCELNNFNKEMKPTVLQYRPGSSYYDLIRDYTIDVSDIP